MRKFDFEQPLPRDTIQALKPRPVTIKASDERCPVCQSTIDPRLQVAGEPTLCRVCLLRARYVAAGEPK